MDAKDVGGHTSALPRLFSIPTLIAGIALTSSGLGQPVVPGIFPPPDEALMLGAPLAVLGLHGVFTNTSGVGIFRKLLSYLSGAAGGVICWRIAMQMGWV